MALEVKYFENKDFINLSIKGNWNNQELEKIANDIADKAKLVNKYKVLINSAEVNLPTNQMQRYLLGIKLSDYWDAKFKVAIIFRKMDIIKFLEYTAQNGGINLKVFFTEQEAVDWLNE